MFTPGPVPSIPVLRCSIERARVWPGLRSNSDQPRLISKKILGALVPQFVIDALNQAKAARLAPAKGPAAVSGPARPALPEADTEGLGAPKKEKKDLYGEEVLKLVELVQAQTHALRLPAGLKSPPTQWPLYSCWAAPREHRAPPHHTPRCPAPPRKM